MLSCSQLVFVSCLATLLYHRQPYTIEVVERLLLWFLLKVPPRSLQYSVHLSPPSFSIVRTATTSISNTSLPLVYVLGAGCERRPVCAGQREETAKEYISDGRRCQQPP